MAAIERKPYMDRIDRLKQRVLKTKPEMDLENAIILTKGFQESEGQPLCIRKAYAFKKQCLEKTVKIWGDKLKTNIMTRQFPPGRLRKCTSRRASRVRGLDSRMDRFQTEAAVLTVFLPKQKL